MKDKVLKDHRNMPDTKNKQSKQTVSPEITGINAAIQLAKSSPNLLTGRQILQLQQSMGNRAVMQLLKAGNGVSSGTPSQIGNNAGVLQKADIYWKEELNGKALENKPQGRNITFLVSDNRNTNNERYKEKGMAHDSALKDLNVSGIEDSYKFYKNIKTGDAGAKGKYTIYPNKVKKEGPTKVLVNHTADPNAKISKVRVANGTELAPTEHTPIDHYHAGYYDEYVTEDTQIDELRYTHVRGSADHYYVFK